MGAVFFGGAGRMGASRMIVAIHLVSIQGDAPAQRKHKGGKKNDRHFPDVNPVMHRNHKRWHTSGQAKPNQQADQAEHRWKHAAEQVRAFRRDHPPEDRFLQALSHRAGYSVKRSKKTRFSL